MLLARRLVVFAVLVALSYIVAGVAVAFGGLTGELAIAGYGVLFSVLLFACTVFCARRAGLALPDVGVQVSHRRGLEVLGGFLAGAVLYAGVLAAVGAMAGGSWIPGRLGFVTLLSGLAVSLALVTGEELLFRGFWFQQLRSTFGPRTALTVTAMAFGAYHVALSSNWAAGAMYTFTLSALGGLVFGYAVIRSGSLALPLGLHWGGNWVQAQVMGLGRLSGAIWAMPLEAAQRRWVVAPDPLPHLPYLILLVLTALLVYAVTSRAARPN